MNYWDKARRDFDRWAYLAFWLVGFSTGLVVGAIIFVISQ